MRSRVNRASFKMRCVTTLRRRDIGTPYKFCFEDVGVRNVASDF